MGSGTGWLSMAWFLSRFATAAGWLAAVKLIKAWFPVEHHPAVIGYLGFSSRMGSFLGTAGLGLMLQHGVHWRQLFVAAAGFSVVAAGVCISLMPNPTESLGPATLAAKDSDHGAEDTKAASAPTAGFQTCKAKTPAEAIRFFAMSPKVWLMVMARALYCMLFELQHFLPLYLRDSLRVTPGAASQLSSLFSIGAGISVLVGECILDGGLAAAAPP